MDKVKMTYKVNKGHNPQTGEEILVPVITRKNSMTLSQLVVFAKSSGYVRGQLKDLEGLLNGFIEAMKDRSQAGYTVNVNDWFIISGVLTGKVGEDRQLTAKNSYRVNIRTSKALKVNIDNFSWSREDESALMRIESLTSPNGNKGEVTADKEIVANGRNVTFDEAKGDTSTFVYIDDATGEPVEVAALPCEKSGTYLRYAAIPALENARVGSTLKLIVNAHDETGALQTATQTAKVLESSVPRPPLKVTSKVTQGENEVSLFTDQLMIEGTEVKNLEDAHLELYKTATGQFMSRLEHMDGTRLTRIDATHVKYDIVGNTSTATDSQWKTETVKLVIKRTDADDLIVPMTNVEA